MAIYLVGVVFVLIAGIFLQAKYINKRIFVTISFTIMALILGLRGNTVGEDTRHFIGVFQYAKDISWKTALTSGTDTIYNTIYGTDLSIETGYLILNKIIGLFTDNAQWLIFVVAVLTCWLFGKFILEQSQHVFFATYIFMCESMYMQSFNLMRQMLAIAIGIQAYTLIKRNQNIKAVLIIILAFLFHKTTGLLFILFFLYRIENKQKSMKYILLGSVLITISVPILYQIIENLIPRYALYFKINYWESTLGVGSSLLLALEAVICVYAYLKKQINKNKDMFIAVSCTVFSIVFELMGTEIVMFSRIALVFKIFLIYLFPMAANFFSKKSRWIYYCGILLVVTLSFISYSSSDTRLYSFFWQ